MPPVVRSARDLLRRPGGWVPATVVAAGGSLGVLLPLFELPGLELGLAVAAPLHAPRRLDRRRRRGASCSGSRGPACLASRRPGPEQRAAGAIGGATLVLWAAAAVPFARRGAPRRAQHPVRPVRPGCLLSVAGCCPRRLPRRGGGHVLPHRVPRPAPAASRCTSCSSSPRSRGRCGRSCSGRRCSPSTSSSGYSPARSTTRRCGCPPRCSGSGWRRSCWAVALGTCAAAVFPAPGPTHPRHRGRVLGTLVVLAPGHRRAGDERGPPRVPQLRRGGAHRPRRTDRDRARGHPLPPREVPRGGGAAPRATSSSGSHSWVGSSALHRPRCRVVVFRSPEEKQRWVGAGGTQFAKPWLASVYLNDAPFPHPTLQHELAHVAAGAFGSGPFRVTSRWGLPLMGVVEGVAVAADDPHGELTLHDWAAGMRRQGLMPDLRGILGAAGFWTAAPARAYTAAGSFLRFLRDTQGTERLQRLLAHGDFAARLRAEPGHAGRRVGADAGRRSRSTRARSTAPSRVSASRASSAGRARGRWRRSPTRREASPAPTRRARCSCSARAPGSSPPSRTSSSPRSPSSGS